MLVWVKVALELMSEIAGMVGVLLRDAQYLLWFALLISSRGRNPLIASVLIQRMEFFSLLISTLFLIEDLFHSQTMVPCSCRHKST